MKHAAVAHITREKQHEALNIKQLLHLEKTIKHVYAANISIVNKTGMPDATALKAEFQMDLICCT